MMSATSPPQLGPAPTEPVPVERVASLSRPARELLRTLGEHGPATLRELVAVTGSHPNTLRDHLRALQDAGLVRRVAGEGRGRGRPPWLYSAVPVQHGPVAEYAGLARTLAGVLHRTSATPVEDAVAAGVAWGHELARDMGGPRPSTAEPARDNPAGDDSGGDDRDDPGRAARSRVVALLDRMGFAPETDPRADPGQRSVRLPRCPLLDAAREYPDVVCGVHLGIARGALREYGADDSGTALLPFSEPGACRLHLAAPPGRHHTPG